MDDEGLPSNGIIVVIVGILIVMAIWTGVQYG